MAALADALGLVRLTAAAALPGALARGAEGSRRWLPLALVGLAVATDFFDGPLARRAGRPTRHGALLDNLADIAVVLAAAGTGTELGLVPWLAPAAMAVAFSAYALASLGTGREGEWRPARSRLGHAAGVCNYLLAVLVAAAVARPDPRWPPVLELASVAVVAVNLGAVLGRLRPSLAEG